MSAEQRLAELGYELPPAPSAVGVYRPAMNVGNLCYTSGHIPLNTDGSMIKGCVGRTADVAEGKAAAVQCGLTILSTLRKHLGSLDRVKRVVKLVGMVNAVEDCTQHPEVINGCSELFKQVFGDEAGIGTRSAVGMSSLPLGVMVEIEGIFEIE